MQQAVQERLLNVVHNCSAGNIKLLTMTLAAMAASEDTINEEIESMNANGSN